MQRLMLGQDGNPQLLVNVVKSGQGYFDFLVINGAWNGRFTYHEPLDLGIGDVFIEETKNTVKDVAILCDNPDRLRGGYETVFANFKDKFYTAPIEYDWKSTDVEDDDIPY